MTDKIKICNTIKPYKNYKPQTITRVFKNDCGETCYKTNAGYEFILHSKDKIIQ